MSIPAEEHPLAISVKEAARRVGSPLTITRMIADKRLKASRIVGRVGERGRLVIPCEASRKHGGAAMTRHENFTLPAFPAELFGQRSVVTIKPPDVRYFITDELWDSFTNEQIQLQRERLEKARRWNAPVGRFTIRIQVPVVLSNDNAPQDSIHCAKAEAFLDMEFDDGGLLVRCIHVGRCQYPGLSNRKRSTALQVGEPRLLPDSYRYETRNMWWERGSHYLGQAGIGG